MAEVSIGLGAGNWGRKRPQFSPSERELGRVFKGVRDRLRRMPHQRAGVGRQFFTVGRQSCPRARTGPSQGGGSKIATRSNRDRAGGSRLQEQV